MTKKDYELIASAIHKMSSLDHGAHLYVADMLAVTLKQDNPRFKRDVFLKACGINSQ